MLDVNNIEQLMNKLSRFDTTVPLRSEGRTKDHVERYCIVRLLATLAECGMINYPLTLEKSERPDFVLNMKGRTVGIEHTEVVSENVAHTDFLRDKGHGPEFYFTPRSIPGEKRKKAKKLLQELKENRFVEPWMGNSIEIEWADAMLFFTERKAESSKKYGYRNYENNWLLLDDNWRPSPDIDDAVSIYSFKYFQNDCAASFDRVFILRNEFLFQVVRGGSIKMTIKKFCG